jgi:predicted RNA-binding protein with PIN domain
MYLVDGNNVMGQRVGWHKDKAGARRRLLGELAGLARASRVTIAVVFDGAPEEHFPDGSSFMGVRVYYAERGSDADARIKAMVEESRERRTLKVVTSDNALAAYVRRCGAEVVRAGEFRRRLEEVAEKLTTGGAARDETEGREGVKASELDEWLYYFGVAPEDDEPPATLRAKPATPTENRGRAGQGGTGRRRTTSKRKR